MVFRNELKKNKNFFYNFFEFKDQYDEVVPKQVFTDFFKIRFFFLVNCFLIFYVLGFFRHPDSNLGPIHYECTALTN